MSAKSLAFVSISALFLSSAVMAAERGGTRFDPLPILLRDVIDLPVGGENEPYEGGVASCPPEVKTWSAANFSGGAFTLQAGFSQGEIAAASFAVPADQFPVRIDLTEMIFATSNTTVTTTTHWSVLFWEGTPATGNLVAVFSSDGTVLPHLVIPPGTNGVNIQFLVDPGDPEQIILQNNGSGIISVGYRIDKHHNLPSGPCGTIPTNSNAFPTTDTNGLQHAANNWLFAITCPLACPGGWFNFNQLISFCKPTGDWNIRVSYTGLGCPPPAPGACCLPSGQCTIALPNECAALGGTFQGANTNCQSANCVPTGNVPCCFQSTGGCLNLSFPNCVAAGGVPGPVGQNCASYTCFATGACCKPDGTCAVMSPADCAAAGGLYTGNNVTCAQANCPPPLGAACFPNGFCLEMFEEDAAVAGVPWAGPMTTCADLNGNGTPDVCEQGPPPIPGDLNGDGFVNGSDLAIVLGNWGGGAGSPGDANGDGVVDGADIALVLGNWTG
ncbi:MAG: hypothetical protein KF724_03895 [Phycisphaeraceae bacterium]|nr:hypothetical protein [Phycisphaeraceae bacterium]